MRVTGEVRQQDQEEREQWKRWKGTASLTCYLVCKQYLSLISDVHTITHTRLKCRKYKLFDGMFLGFSHHQSGQRWTLSQEYSLARHLPKPTSEAREI